MITGLAGRVLEAYGGETMWAAARTLHAHISASGWAFRLKFQPPDRNAAVEAALGRPYVRFEPTGRGRHIAILDGQSVRLEDASGRTVAERADPRRFFPYGRRAFWWDDLDRAYFSAYALWNYLTFPALLLRDDIEWRELAGHRLEARFPPSLPTHSARQVFHFHPETARLERLDYTAEVFGAWARAANVVLDHANWEGIPYPSWRRVTPIGLGGRPMRGPVLVEIRVHSWRLE